MGSVRSRHMLESDSTINSTPTVEPTQLKGLTGNIRSVDPDAAVRMVINRSGGSSSRPEAPGALPRHRRRAGPRAAHPQGAARPGAGRGPTDPRAGRRVGLRRLVRDRDLRRAGSQGVTSSGAWPSTTDHVKQIELTAAGIEAQAWAASRVYGPRAGFTALTASEQRTLARLLGKLADAQAAHDRATSDDPRVRGLVRQLSAAHPRVPGPARRRPARRTERGARRPAPRALQPARRARPPARRPQGAGPRADRSGQGDQGRGRRRREVDQGGDQGPGTPARRPGQGDERRGQGPGRGSVAGPERAPTAGSAQGARRRR